MKLGKSDEEKQARAEAHAAQEQERAKQRATEERNKRYGAFLHSPAGRARAAFERGDQVFQYSANVMSQKAVVVAMVGASAPQSTSDPSVVLNSVANEGWELVSGSFVFVETGQQSRDKLMSSGQNVAISGATIGYYLFKRCEGNKRDVGNPWDVEPA